MQTTIALFLDQIYIVIGTRGNVYKKIRGFVKLKIRITTEYIIKLKGDKRLHDSLPKTAEQAKKCQKALIHDFYGDYIDTTGRKKHNILELLA